ncbi:hypothetical protein [Aurantimonas coralicida]|uniref:hypothetical protein n=1 Tax=Aurantimonas coralicida TaxID=182270 RepID=UPI001D195E68|nr:hypothetical protein [Aurantimonas coralicida]MCC4298417.1 hypothetical protein [Aurantimonas coralicida]
MTTEHDSNQNTEKDGDKRDIERPAPRRPAFLNDALTLTQTAHAIGNLMMKRREKRGW